MTLIYLLSEREQLVEKGMDRDFCGCGTIIANMNFHILNLCLLGLNSSDCLKKEF